MIEKINNLFLNIGINNTISSFISEILVIAIIILTIYCIYKITQDILKGIVEKIIKNNKYKWDDVLIKRKVTDKIANLFVAIVTYFIIPFFGLTYKSFVNNVIYLYIIIMITHIIAVFLGCINDIYNNFDISKSRPIKGLIQVFQVVVYICGAIILVSALLNQSPIMILSGLGALSAVLLIVFKDSLLGFVSGIQISANNMVKIGDWITIPSCNAEGTVIDISLNTITLENFDKTITSIPAYTLVSNSFKNWKGMEQAGSRRMKRAIYIDVNSVKFCDKEMLKRFKNVNYLTDYINGKEEEIAKYNEIHGANSNEVINLRRLTNIGTFRVYINNYLKFHPKINPELTLLVRQLSPNEHGIPLEIYAFINDTKWANYENIQSDIFDHIYSVAKEFDIKISQSPVGSDFERIKLK